MLRPFAIKPALSGHFPSPSELKAALAAAPRAMYEVVVRLWISEGLPSAFLASPAAYEDMRGWLGARLAVHPKEITVIGSARIGYSLAPAPNFGREFSSRSDLDLSLVSDDLFKRVSVMFSKFSADYRSSTVAPRTEQERQIWEENIAFGDRNLPRGFIDPNKIPNFQRYPLAQEISQCMWMLVKRLDITPGGPKVRRATTRVYRDWHSFVTRLSINLQTALA